MPNNKGYRRILSKTEQSDIKTRFRKGEPAKSIANRLECSVNTVYFYTRGLAGGVRLGQYVNYLKKLNKISDTDRGWVAGIIDGEGSLSLSNRKDGKYLNPRVTVASTDDYMTPRLLKLCGGNLGNKFSDPRANRRDQRRWTIDSGWAVRAFCEWIENTLVVKRKHATLIIEFCRSRMTSRTRMSGSQTAYAKRELTINIEVKRLNRRGRNG